MPSLRQIRRQIRSVQNIAKVTRAMEMVAATKMRRAQASALATRPYAEHIRYLLGDVAVMARVDEQPHPFLVERPVRRVEVIHITPERGLCGALPANLNRRLTQFILEAGVPVSVIAVGRKGRDFLVRYRADLRAVFTGLGDRPTLMDVMPIIRLAIDDYLGGHADRVYIHYAHLVSTMVQRPTLYQVLPIPQGEIPAGHTVGYLYEPSPREVLEALLPRYVEVQVYSAVLETLASEHSARMVAMRNATENAKEVVRGLTLLANKVRQETITKELLDIVGGTWTFQQR